MIATLTHALLKALSLIPRPMTQQLGKWVGILNYTLETRAAQVTSANIDLCLPDIEDKDQFARLSLIETGKTLMETPAVWLGDAGRTDQWIETVHNEALLQEHIDNPAGLLMLLPHLGNWELFNVFYRRYGQMTALYQPPRRDFMKKVMAKVREHHGNVMLPTTRAGLKQLYKTLGEGGTVVVLPDQVPASGRFVPFFGEPALTDTLTARLLGKTGASALGIAIVRNPTGLFDVHIRPPDKAIYDPDEAVSLEAVNQLMESCAMIAPTQYQWDYKRFRERPAGSRKIYRFNKPPAVHD